MQKAKLRKPLKVLLTAGPTRAYLDRVRFLSNFSTGEVGFLTSKNLTENGVEVFAVVGPTSFPFEKLKLKKLVRVETNEEMEREVFKILKKEKPAWGVFSSAVLDFRPRRVGKGKTTSKKAWVLELVPTRKIIDRVTKEFPKVKKIGFKLEWEKLSAKALLKTGKSLLEEKDYAGLVMNFLPEVKSKNSHKAYMFSESKKGFVNAKTKIEIAKWITGRVME